MLADVTFVGRQSPKIETDEATAAIIASLVECNRREAAAGIAAGSAEDLQDCVVSGPAGLGRPLSFQVKHWQSDCHSVGRCRCSGADLRHSRSQLQPHAGMEKGPRHIIEMQPFNFFIRSCETPRGTSIDRPEHRIRKNCAE